MKFFTLLHIAEKEKSTHNNKSKSFAGQIQIYINCIKVLHASLHYAGYKLAVLTNNKTYIENFLDGYDIEIIELQFTMNVPSGVNFYSTHYKNEVYQYFGSLNEDYVALIDSDMICINKMPLSFKSCIENGIPLYYDISDQVHPVFGQDVIVKDKKVVDKTAKVGIWAGGEFIAGKPEFFKQLYQQIEEFSPAYFNNINTFSHQGDEFLTSVVIENGILNKKYAILNAGMFGIICRYWSYPTIHEQPALDVYKEHFFLHLPSNKKLLAGIDVNKVDFSAIYSFLKPRISVIHSVNVVKDIVKKLLPSQQKH